jgi:tetratricopeptide (TPR) repeat protein
MHSYEVSYPENIFLQAAAEYGFAGLGVLVFFIFLVLRRPDRAKNDFYAAFCGLIAVNMAGVDINYGTSAMMAAVLSGVLMNGRQGHFFTLDMPWKKTAAFVAAAIAAVILAAQINILISDVYLDRAIAFSVAKQWRESIENYKKALIHNPRNVPAVYFLASAYYDSDPVTNAPAALSELEEVERTAPDYVLLHYKKAVILSSMGNDAAAIAEYGKMLKIDPYLAPVLVELAYIYYRKGDMPLAEQYMKRAADISKNDAGLYNNLGNIYFIQKKVSEAVLAYKKAIEIKADKDYYYNLACVYFTSKDIGDAGKTIDKAVELDEKSGSHETKISDMAKMIKRYGRAGK